MISVDGIKRTMGGEAVEIIADVTMILQDVFTYLTDEGAVIDLQDVEDITRAITLNIVTPLGYLQDEYLEEEAGLLIKIAEDNPNLYGIARDISENIRGRVLTDEM